VAYLHVERNHLVGCYYLVIIAHKGEWSSVEWDYGRIIVHPRRL
jgi:hypothetical protein